VCVVRFCTVAPESHGADGGPAKSSQVSGLQCHARPAHGAALASGVRLRGLQHPQPECTRELSDGLLCQRSRDRASLAQRYARRTAVPTQSAPYGSEGEDGGVLLLRGPRGAPALGAVVRAVSCADG
jgi:hypothetical protein